MWMRCKQCAHPLEPTDRACPGCGAAPHPVIEVRGVAYEVTSLLGREVLDRTHDRRRYEFWRRQGIDREFWLRVQRTDGPRYYCWRYEDGSHSRPRRWPLPRWGLPEEIAHRARQIRGRFGRDADG